MSLLGRLGEQAFKHDMIEYAAGLSMVLGGIFVVALLVPLKHSNGFFPFRFLEEALRNPTPTSTVEPTMTTISEESMKE